MYKARERERVTVWESKREREHSVLESKREREHSTPATFTG